MEILLGHRPWVTDLASPTVPWLATRFFGSTLRPEYTACPVALAADTTSHGLASRSRPRRSSIFWPKTPSTSSEWLLNMDHTTMSQIIYVETFSRSNPRMVSCASLAYLAKQGQIPFSFSITAISIDYGGNGRKLNLDGGGSTAARRIPFQVSQHHYMMPSMYTDWAKM